jgi:putative membrane protein
MRKTMSEITLYFIITVFFVFTPWPSFAQWRGPCEWGYGRGMGWIGPIGMILFWIVIIVLVVVIIRWVLSASKSTPVQGSGDDPLKILKRRHASGEIPRETYEDMKKDLEK